MKPPFSPSVTRNGFTFISGQIHLKNGKLLEGTIEDQTHQVMKNLQDILRKEGLDFQDVVKATIYCTDLSIYEKINPIYASYFKTSFPAREFIGIKELPLKARIEISMIAAK